MLLFICSWREVFFFKFDEYQKKQAVYKLKLRLLHTYKKRLILKIFMNNLYGSSIWIKSVLGEELNEALGTIPSL